MKNRKKIWLIAILSLIAVIAIGITVSIVISDRNNVVKTKLTVEEAQEMLDSQLDALPEVTSYCIKYLRENSSVSVKSVEYGKEKNIILDCEYKTLNIYSVIEDNVDSFLNIEMEKPNGKKKNATEVQLEINEKFLDALSRADEITGSIKIEIFELSNGSLSFYLDDYTVNAVFGGVIEAVKLVKNTNTITVDGKEVDISRSTTLRTGLNQCFELRNYDSSRPDTSHAVVKAYNVFKNDFYRNFIQDNRWLYLVKGLGTTLSITALALVLGLAIGFVVAIIRTTYAKTGKLEILDAVSRFYVAVMRGTPVMIQLLIIYFVLLLPLNVDKFTAAVLCFGINSGAYVSEIVRGGIMSVDHGQLEAGRSLGFNYVATMWYIVIPQAIKAVLPALANEFIALLKETSVAFYIGVADLTLGGLKIRSITYSNFMPLIAIGLIYLVLVLALSKLVSLLERRMNKSDRG